MSYEVGTSKIGNRAIVNALAVEDNKTRTLDIVTTDYFSTSAFPFNLPTESSTSLESLYASPARLKDLISLFKSGIIQQLMPGLLKSSVSEEANDIPVASTSTQERRGYYPDPGGAFVGGQPQHPQPFGEGRRNFPGGIGGIPSIGQSDLDPLAGLGGTTGGRVPLGGLGGDGMIVGPNHPLFRDRFPQDPAGLGEDVRGRLWGGDGFLPPGAVPPGARFDPVGPGFPGQGPAFPGRGRGGRNFGDAMRPPTSDYDHMFG